MSRNDNLVRTIELKDRNGRVVGTKEVVTYAGLLNLGHDEGLVRIDTTLIQTPTEANEHMAVVSASVETKRGVFKAHGDASPENVNSRIAPHIIRMAETRAKARALRDAVNIGVVSIEELGLDGNGELADREVADRHEPASQPNEISTRGSRSSAPRRTAGVTKARQRTEAAAPVAANPTAMDRGASNAESMTAAQRRYLFRLLADEGIEGDSAHDYLMEHFKVDSLRKVSKVEASSLIEELLKGADGQEAKAA